MRQCHCASRSNHFLTHQSPGGAGFSLYQQVGGASPLGYEHSLVLCRVKVFKQKIKHLLFEHKVAVDQLRTENQAALKLAAEKHRMDDLQLRRDKASLKERMHQQQLEHEELVKTVKKVR